MNVRLVIASCAALLSIAATSVGQAAPVEPASSTLVIAVEEATSKAQCKMFDEKGEIPCPAGSVVWADVMTYGEAKAANIKDYTVVTGDAKSVEQQRGSLVEKVRARYKNELKAIQSNGDTNAFLSCTPTTKDIYGQYTFRFGVAGTVYYHLTYQINSNCSVVNITDSSKASGWSDPIKWNSSCTAGASQCINYFLGLNNSWSQTFVELSSTYGAEYRHNSQTASHFTYGYWTFTYN